MASRAGRTAGQPRQVVRRDASAVLEVKKSRFIAHVWRVASAQEAGELIAAVRKEHWQARHHCTALVVGALERSNDDGEPAGTAGAPMLQVLRSYGLLDALAVVTRYFGGTLLGTGGLVRAYSAATAQAIEAAGVVPLVEVVDCEVSCPAADAGRCENTLRLFLTARGLGGPVPEYGMEARFALTVPSADVAELSDQLRATAPNARIAVGISRLAPLPTVGT